MAHEMEGDWRCFRLVNGVRVPDGVIHLNRINPNTLEIEDGTHEFPDTPVDPIPIEGRVESVGGNIFRLIMERDEIDTARRKGYDATVFLSLRPMVDLTVMVGLKSSLEPLKAQENRKLLNQEDGTVIITRP